jgi:hypothetical protein
VATSFVERPGQLPSIVKDPDAVLDYKVAWSDWLDGDALASVSWDVPTGITSVTESINTGGTTTIDGVVYAASTVATIWLSGGTAGSSYTIRCRATSNSSPARVDDRSFRVLVTDR